MPKSSMIETEAALMFFAHRNQCTLLDACLIHNSFALELFLQTDPFATKDMLRALLDYLDLKIDVAEYSRQTGAATKKLSLSSAAQQGFAPTAH